MSILDEIAAGTYDPTKPASTSPAGTAVEDQISRFIADNAPAAVRVSEQTGVDPDVILAQWGHETGWGKSVIPGSNNLGNVKAGGSWSGRTVAATDNMTGSRDPYRAYDSADAAADDFSGLLTRRYPGALKTGGDMRRYAEALKRGGYAEDPNYVQRLGSAHDAVRRRIAGFTGDFATMREALRQQQPVAAAGDTKPLQDLQAKPAFPAEFSPVTSGAYDEAWQEPKQEDSPFMRGAATAVKQVPQMAAGAAAFIGDALGIDWLKNSGLEFSKSIADDIAKGAKRYDDVTDAIKDGEFINWLKFASGYSALQLVQALATGGIGAVVGKAGLGRLFVATAEKASEEALKRGATAAVASAIGEKAAGVAAAKFGAALGLTANSGTMELGSIYPEAVAEAAKKGEPVDLARVGIAAAGATALDVVPDMLLAGKLLDSATRTPGSLIRRMATGVPKQAGIEAGTEGAQTVAERWGAKQEVMSPEGQKDIVNSAAMGALGGAFGGGMAAIPGQQQPAQPPAPPAMKPNSPLSNAANTATHAANAAAAAAAGAAAPSGDFMSRLDAVTAAAVDRELLRAMRADPNFGPESVSDLLHAVSVARNRTIDPGLRGRALGGAERLLNVWAQRPNFTIPAQGPVGTDVATVPPQRPDFGPQGQFPTNRPLLDNQPSPIDGQATRVPDVPLLPQGGPAQPAPRTSPASPLSPRGIPGRVPPVPPIGVMPEAQAGRSPAQPPETGHGQRQETQVLNGRPAQLPAPAPVPAPQQEIPSAAQAPQAVQGQPQAQEEQPDISGFEEFKPHDLTEEVRVDGVSGWLPTWIANGRRYANLGEIVEIPESAVREARPIADEAKRQTSIDRAQLLDSVGVEDGDAARAIYNELTDEERAALKEQLDQARDTFGDERVQQIAAQAQSESTDAPSYVARFKELAAVRPADPQEQGQGDAGAAPAAPAESAAAAEDVARAAENQRIAEAAHEAATSDQNDRSEPTPAQMEAGNYKKGLVRLYGLEIMVENPKDSTRVSKERDEDGDPHWSVVMPAHYGYIRRTEGADGDQVDAFIGEHPDSQQVWVVNQNKPDSTRFDEHKVMLGFDTEDAAIDAYMDSFSDGWGAKVFSSISGPFTVEEFKARLQAGEFKKSRPVKDKAAVAAAHAGGDRSWIRDDIQKLIRLKGSATVAQRHALDAIVDKAKAWMAGEDVKPGWFQTNGLKLKALGGAFEIVRDIAERIKALAKFRADLDALNAGQWPGEKASEDAKQEQPNAQQDQSENKPTDATSEQEQRFAEIRARSAEYATSTFVPAIQKYLQAFDSFGVGSLEKNGIKPKGASAREWLESFVRRQSTWEGGRKTGLTGIQYLSTKDLWPTGDARGENLRKAMLEAVKAYKNAPSTNSTMLSEAFGETTKKPAAPQRFPYPDTTGEPAAEAEIKRSVVDVQNGDKPRDQLRDELVASGLPEGTIRALTQRLGDNQFSNGEIAAMLEERAKPTPQPPTVDIDAELQDALSHLGDVLGDVFGAQLKITGPEYGAKDLLPALSKVIELLVKKGFRSFKEAVGASAKAMRANAKTAEFVDKVSARQWKAAYNSVAEFHEGTDSEESVSAVTADDVEDIVSAAPESAEAVPSLEPVPEDGERGRIARMYAEERKVKYGGSHNGEPTETDFRFADDILNKNAYGLQHLANGMNDAAKAVFSRVTGVELPKQQGETWKAIRAWAGVSDARDAEREAARRVEVEAKAISGKAVNLDEGRRWITSNIANGFNQLRNIGGHWYLSNAEGQGFDLSRKGSRLSLLRPLIAAEIEHARARAAVSAEDADTSPATQAGMSKNAETLTTREDAGAATAQSDPRMQDLARKVLKIAEGGSVLYGKNVANRLYGPQAENARIAIMHAIEGKPVPKSKSGHKAVLEALYRAFGIGEGAPVEREGALQEALLKHAGATDAGPQESSGSDALDLMSADELPTEPLPVALDLAREILRSRFIVDSKDVNSMLEQARQSGIPHRHLFYGPNSRDARHVIEFVANENLNKAPEDRLKKRIETLGGNIDASVSASMARFNPDRLGGPGAGGRAKQQMHDGERRNILSAEVSRLKAELDRRAEVVAATAPGAQHIEDGQSEPATTAVISESLKKADKNTEMDLREAKKWLLSEIDKAIAQAPKENPNDAMERERTLTFNPASIDGFYKMSYADQKKAGEKFIKERDRRIEELSKTLQFITFNVPGDGKFKVINSVPTLQRFRGNVERSPGFSPPKKPGKPSSASNPSVTIRDMLDDGDLTAAHELASVRGVPFRYGVTKDGPPMVITDAEEFEYRGVRFFVGRSWVRANNGAGQWTVAEATTGGGVGGRGTTREAQVSFVKYLLDEKWDNFSENLKKTPKVSQEELDAAWMEWAQEEEKRIDDREAIASKARAEHDARVERLAASLREATNGEWSADAVLHLQANETALRKAIAQADERGRGDAALQALLTYATESPSYPEGPMASLKRMKTERDEFGGLDGSDWYSVVPERAEDRMSYRRDAGTGDILLATVQNTDGDMWVARVREDGRIAFDTGEVGLREAREKADRYIESYRKRGGPAQDAAVPAIAVPEGYKQVAESYFGGTVQKPIYGPFAVGDKVVDTDTGWRAEIEAFFTSPENRQVIDRYRVKYENGAGETLRVRRLKPAEEANPSEQPTQQAQAESYRKPPKVGPQGSAPKVALTAADENEFAKWVKRDEARAVEVVPGRWDVRTNRSEPTIADGRTEGEALRAYWRHNVSAAHDEPEKAEEAAKPAAKNFRNIDRLNPLTAPVEDGDWFKIDGKDWQARNGYTGRGWALIDADKKTHPTIHDITANSDLISMIVKEADSTSKAPVENQFADYDAVAREYGYQVLPDGTLATEEGKESGLRMSVSKGRFRVESKKTGDLTFSGEPKPETIGRFVEKFWYAEKKKPTAPAADKSQISEGNTQEAGPQQAAGSSEPYLDFGAGNVELWGASELARRAAWFQKYGYEKYANNPAFVALREALMREFGTDNIADFASGKVRGESAVDASIAHAKKKGQATSPALDLMKDGIEGREIPYSEVPNGNEAFQYALGRTEEGGAEAVYRRRADERGTYGGWRWEADAVKVAQESGSDQVVDANTYTEAEALKRMSRADGGTSGGIKTYTIEFFDADSNMDTGRGGARHAYIEQSVGRGGDKKYRVYSRGGDYISPPHDSLKTATEAAKQETLKSVRSDGYIRDVGTVGDTKGDVLRKEMLNRGFEETAKGWFEKTAGGGVVVVSSSVDGIVVSQKKDGQVGGKDGLLARVEVSRLTFPVDDAAGAVKYADGLLRSSVADDSGAYQEKIEHWDGILAKFGVKKAVEEARNAVAGQFIGRAFNQAAEDFYSSNPAARATRDWLRAHDARNGEADDWTPQDQRQDEHSGGAKDFATQTLSQLRAENGTQGVWLGNVVKNGEAHPVRITYKGKNAADWWFDIYADGKVVQSIPFPRITGAFTAQKAIDDLMTWVRIDDKENTWEFSEIGKKHTELLGKKEESGRKKDAAAMAAMRKFRGDTEPRPWDETDLKDKEEHDRLAEMHFKSAANERHMELLEQRIKGNPSKWSVGDGVSYKVFGGGKRGSLQTNHGFRIADIDPETKTATIVQVADTGLTTTGGNDGLGAPMVIHVGELTRERKYDAHEKAPDSGAPGKAPAAAVTDSAVAAHDALMARLRDGTATLEEYKAGFRAALEGRDKLREELAPLKKDDLLKRMGFMMANRMKSERKADVVDAAVEEIIGDYIIARALSYGMGKGARENAIKALVERTTEQDLAEFAQKVSDYRNEREERVKKLIKAVKNPETLEEFRQLLRVNGYDSLTPEQRARYDELQAEKTRADLAATADDRATVKAAATTTTGEVIETKHTKTGEPLFVVKPAERVEREVYNQWNAAAKRMGGWYSSYRGGGAVPGFQFKTRENAEAFSKFLTGDTEAAQEAVDARREEKDDDRSQSAVERLREMADRLDEAADGSLGKERKANTARRARMAGAAEAAARNEKAMAATMRNLANAIENGAVKHLGQVRQKVQVETLIAAARLAHFQMSRQMAMRETGGNYASGIVREKYEAQPWAESDVEFAEYPSYSMYRDGLASLARRMAEVEGMKQFAAKLEKYTGDDADYVDFVKKNLGAVALRTNSGSPAIFPSRDAAHAAWRRSPSRGNLMIVSIDRGVNAVVPSPSVAKERGLWKGQDDKLIRLPYEVGEELLDRLKAYNRNKARFNQIEAPWQLESAREKLSRYKAMGILNPPMFRAALREFIRLNVRPEPPSRVAQLERALVGRKDVGVDFFPTPKGVAADLVDRAGVTEDMAVLEPSAGNGNIADAIREAGAEPDVVEQSSTLREILEAKDYDLVGYDFLDLKERPYTFGDVFRAPDGTVGVMRGGGGMGSNRVTLDPLDANGAPDARTGGYYDRDTLVPVERRGSGSGYDRIIMNPPFGGGADMDHVRHAYSLLKPGGKIVAIMSEGSFYRTDRKATEFRDWLDSLGGESEKLPEGTFLDPSLPTTTGVNARVVTIEKPAGDETRGAPSESEEVAPQFSMNAPGENERFAAEFLAELAADDDFFRFPVSDKTTLRSVFAEVYPGARYLGEDTVPETNSAEAVHKFESHNGKVFYVFTRGREAWIDISRLEEGDRGQAVYAAAFNWAYNTRRKLIGDPQGLTEAAVVRRTSAMLSSALRFGTTEHMEASPEQIAGIPEQGIAPLDWWGDDVARTAALIHTFLSTLNNQFPQLKNYRYDFGTRQFVDRSGRSVGIDRFADGARLGVARSSRAGEATLRRGVLFQSLVSSEGEARPGLLEQVLSRGSELSRDDSLRGIFSREEVAAPGGSPESVRQSLVDRFGEDTISVLEQPGRLVITDSRDSPIPVPDDAEAYYDGQSGTAYLFSDRLSGQRAAQVLLHEIGEHYGLESWLGEAGYRALGARVAMLARQKGSAAEAAWSRVKKLYPEFSGLNDAGLRDNKRFLSEVIARIGESAAGRKTGFWRDLVTAAKRFLAKLGFTRFVDEEDIGYFMLGSLRKAAGRPTGGPAPQGGLSDEAATMAVGFMSRRDVTETPEFKRWFGDSKVVDADGKPLVVYHGTTRDFLSFDPMTMGEKTGAADAKAGFFFAENPSSADQFTWENGDKSGSIMPVYLALKNPIVSSHQLNGATGTAAGKIISDAKAAGHDGVIFENSDMLGHKGKTYVAFRPEQIKSATGNRGTFDPSNPDIRYSRKSEDPYADDPRMILNITPGGAAWSLPSLQSVRSAMEMYEKALAPGGALYRADAGSRRQAVIDAARRDYNTLRRHVGLPEVAEWKDVQFSMADTMDTLTAPPSPTDKPFLRKIRSAIHAIFNSSETFNVWNRTVGSQYEKAKKDPKHFGRVFDLAQTFIDDMSRSANEAADLAPGLLPKMEKLSDAISTLGNLRADAKDQQAISKAVFEGTIRDRRWTRDELLTPPDELGRPVFAPLTERQADLYFQFRAAVDKSLDDLAISEMARVSKAAGLNLHPRDEELSLQEVADFYAEQFQAQLEAAMVAREEMERRHPAELKLLEDAADDTAMKSGEFARQRAALVARQNEERAEADKIIVDLGALFQETMGKAEKIGKLKAQGYAPLMRFGRYTVDVFLPKLDADGNPELDEKGRIKVEKDPDGNDLRPFFYMFETEAEAVDAAAAMAEEFPEHTVVRGVLSEESFRLFKGVTPETLEVMADMIGREQDEAFQAYLKLAIANRSAMKRLIHRKAVAGFAEDPARVLASFITSNARSAARNWHLGDMLKAAVDIPKEKGDVKDEAVRLMEYVQNPMEEAPLLRSMLFANFLGGSVAAALTNTTQTFTTTFPFLSQYMGSKAAPRIVDAMRLAGRRMGTKGTAAITDPTLKDALMKAEEEGVVSPHEVHMLYGEAMRNGIFSGNRATRAIMRVWGSFFSLAEQFNREVAFIAAFKAASANREVLEKSGFDNAYEFAKDAVAQTQFIYSKANRPNWARGPVGATVFTFKTFVINYLEFMRRLPGRERALALGVLALLSGLSGLPFADDLDDLLETIAQALGYGFNAKQTKQAFMENVFGKDMAGFILHGASYGLALDFGARLSVANVIPGTSLLKRSQTDKSRDFAEVLGPAAGLIQQYLKAWDVAVSGEPMRAVGEAMPKTVTDAIRAIEMYQTGAYKDLKGRKIIDVDGIDAMAKLAGFNPQAVAVARRAEWMVQRNVSLARSVEQDIAELWARGISEKDQAKVIRAREQLADWNRKNPDLPIRINPSQIAKRVQAMGLTSTERIIKAAPRELRQNVRSYLESEGSR